MQLSKEKAKQLANVQFAGSLLLKARASDLLLAKSDEHLEKALKEIAEVIAIEVE